MLARFFIPSENYKQPFEQQRVGPAGSRQANWLVELIAGYLN
ncbi:hypothetical protein [Fulvimarina sp. MAC3]